MVLLRILCQHEIKTVKLISTLDDSITLIDTDLYTNVFEDETRQSDSSQYYRQKKS